MLGRILGGIATSLLNSSFESWLVAEHNKVCYCFTDVAKFCISHTQLVLISCLKNVVLSAQKSRFCGAWEVLISGLCYKNID